MKKMMIIVVILCSVLAAQSLTVTRKGGCSVRDYWVPHPQSAPVCAVNEGATFEIVETHSDWVKVRVEAGSIHTNKVGWMWTGALQLEGDTAIVTGAGSCEGDWKGIWLRKGPVKSSKTELAKVKDGADVIILERKVTWYKIQGTPESGFKFKWVYAGNISIN